MPSEVIDLQPSSGIAHHKFWMWLSGNVETWGTHPMWLCHELPFDRSSSDTKGIAYTSDIFEHSAYFEWFIICQPHLVSICIKCWCVCIGILFRTCERTKSVLFNKLYSFAFEYMLLILPKNNYNHFVNLPDRSFFVALATLEFTM